MWASSAVCFFETSSSERSVRCSSIVQLFGNSRRSLLEVVRSLMMVARL